jgi:putative ABC transport system substrate-binding protein
VLSSTHPPKEHNEAFRRGLADLGYVEGKSIVIDWRWAEGTRERLGDLAADLVRLGTDVIVTGGTQAARAAKQATATIPIVMATGGDPVGSGLVASLARPGGNLTGLSSLAHGTVRKQFELLLKEVAPKVSRVAILWNPDNPTHATQLTEAVMARHRAEALVILTDGIFTSYAGLLAELAARGRLPAIYSLAEYAESGGLMSYGASRREMYRRAAAYVDKILRGAVPADLPVEQATRFELVINLKTAKALRLTIPPALLQRADQVIE